MIEVFAAFALGAASTGAAFFFADRMAKAERARLLDRVMARDWESYVIARNSGRPSTSAVPPADPEEEAMAEASRGLL